jgi:dihydroorotate dehydrogenase
MYQRLIRPLLFRLDPEMAHQFTLSALSMAGELRLPLPVLRALFPVPTGKGVSLFGKHFRNPVGLAAGMDKDGEAIDAMAALGFGFLELGTVTPLAQPGNPKPRLFRYPQTHAVVNRMGFNNAGVEALVNRVRRYRVRAGAGGPVIGINIGKQKSTALEQAVEDYVAGFRAVADVADYVAVNISSPNTPDLRKLQDREPLEALLRALSALNGERAMASLPRVPTLLKIAPDLNEAQLDEVVQLVMEQSWDGIIATNTTIDRSGDRSHYESPGGLSGRPLKDRSTQVIRRIAKVSGGKLPIMGVGGIESASDAREKLDAGATLVQVYSGFIYEGPRMVQRLVRGL